MDTPFVTGPIQPATAPSQSGPSNQHAAEAVSEQMLAELEARIGSGKDVAGFITTMPPDLREQVEAGLVRRILTGVVPDAFLDTIAPSLRQRLLARMVERIAGDDIPEAFLETEAADTEGAEKLQGVRDRVTAALAMQLVSGARPVSFLETAPAVLGEQVLVALVDQILAGKVPARWFETASSELRGQVLARLVDQIADGAAPKTWDKYLPPALRDKILADFAARLASGNGNETGWVKSMPPALWEKVFTEQLLLGIASGNIADTWKCALLNADGVSDDVAQRLLHAITESHDQATFQRLAKALYDYRQSSHHHVSYTADDFVQSLLPRDVGLDLWQKEVLVTTFNVAPESIAEAIKQAENRLNTTGTNDKDYAAVRQLASLPSLDALRRLVAWWAHWIAINRRDLMQVAGEAMLMNPYAVLPLVEQLDKGYVPEGKEREQEFYRNQHLAFDEDLTSAYIPDHALDNLEKALEKAGDARIAELKTQRNAKRGWDHDYYQQLREELQHCDPPKDENQRRESVDYLEKVADQEIVARLKAAPQNNDQDYYTNLRDSALSSGQSQYSELHLRQTLLNLEAVAGEKIVGEQQEKRRKENWTGEQYYCHLRKAVLGSEEATRAIDAKRLKAMTDASDRVKHYVARQLADMSEDRYQDKKKIGEWAKDQLRRHAQPIMLWRVQDPKEDDLELRASYARLLANMEGREAADALVRAVVGEERNRNARQDLLSEYYLKPSKERGEQAAELLTGAATEAKRALRILQGLNILLFIVGLGIVAVGLWIAMGSAGGVNPAAGALLSATGLGAVLTQMVKNPLDRIQNAMTSLVQLETAFTSFIWELNLNGTFIQSKYVNDGQLDDQAIEVTNARIEHAMNTAMSLAALYTKSGEGNFPALITRVEPSILKPGSNLTLHGYRLAAGDGNGAKASAGLIAINHKLVPVAPEDVDWNETYVTFRVPRDASIQKDASVPMDLGLDTKIAWVSLIVAGSETNALPIQLLPVDEQPAAEANASAGAPIVERYAAALPHGT